MNSLAFKIVDFGIQLAVILFAISFHESAHAYSALKFGDTTARDLGRISLNPIRHLDPFGSVLLPLFMYIISSGRMIFGAAKPTPVDLRNTRNPRLANLVVSAAGPVSNFFLAAVALAGLLIIKKTSPGSIVELAYAIQRIRFAPGAMAPVVYVLFNFAMVNVALGVFNLIPIPPLDGSHVIRHFLSEGVLQVYDRVGMWGLVILMFFGGSVLGAFMYPVLNFFNGFLLGL